MGYQASFFDEIERAAARGSRDEKTVVNVEVSGHQEPQLSCWECAALQSIIRALHAHDGTVIDVSTYIRLDEGPTVDVPRSGMKFEAKEE